jgi:hypothetical protein
MARAGLLAVLAAAALARGADAQVPPVAPFPLDGVVATARAAAEAAAAAAPPGAPNFAPTGLKRAD